MKIVNSMKRIIGIVIVCLFIVSCIKDDTTAYNQDEQTLKHEKLYSIKTVAKPLTKAIALSDKMWQSGDTIKIKFLNGNSQLQDAVKQVAATWLDYAYLKFEYVDNNADVKIGFDMDNRYISWSTIGTDCKLVSQSVPSTNFVDLEYSLEDSYEAFQGDVLRAFGHILGLGFEHRNPESPVIFKANAQSYFEDYYGLSSEEAAELLDLYNTNQTNYSDYDPLSIMVLEIPSTIVTKKNMAVSANTELSDTDKEFIASLYPKIYFEKIDLKADGYSNTLTACMFSSPMSLFCELNNVIYCFSPYSAACFDETKNPNVWVFTDGLTGGQNFPSMTDSFIYYNSGTIVKCLNMYDKTVTNVQTIASTGYTKGLDGRTYFTNGGNLYYFDADGTAKKRSLYDNEGNELQLYRIMSMFKDLSGVIYILGNESNVGNSTQHIFTLDSDTVELKIYRQSGSNLDLFLSPSGKLYYNSNYRQFGSIENGIMHPIYNSSTTMIPIVNKDGKIYCSLFPHSNKIFSYENGQFTEIERDELSDPDMLILKVTPLKYSPEIIVFARNMQDVGNPFDIFIINPDGDNYAHRLSIPDGLILYKVIERADGQLFFSGGSTTESGLWRFNKNLYEY
jgi:hypothetical protein